jgi:hypothetical protein
MMRPSVRDGKPYVLRALRAARTTAFVNAVLEPLIQLLG